jgi:hypothetical protein
MAEAENELVLLTTMGWACRTLGVPPARVWRLVEQGHLSQPKRQGSVLLFSEEEVFALKGNLPKRKKESKETSECSGELFSKLFTHFRNKLSLQDIVILEKLSPETVRKAHIEYEAGFRNPLPTDILDIQEKAKLEVLARRERIRNTELEIAQERSRSREQLSLMQTERKRSENHSNNLRAITGGKTK